MQVWELGGPWLGVTEAPPTSATESTYGIGVTLRSSSIHEIGWI
jgi:hypothetical protein